MLSPISGLRVFKSLAFICAFAASVAVANDSETQATPVAAESTSEIVTQPQSQTVDAGSAVTLFVVTDASAPAYQWKKDGFAIAGATQASFTIHSTQPSDRGNYTVDITTPAGTITSNTALLEVSAVRVASVGGQLRRDPSIPSYVPPPGTLVTTPVADGFATGTTGGGNAPTMFVTNAAEFKTLAESPSTEVILISGTISLRSLPATVSIKSNKTIMGLDASATIDGPLFLGPNTNNVIIHGINLTFPTVLEDGAEISPPSLPDFDAAWNSPGGTSAAFAGTGGTPLIIAGASQIYVTHCSFFDAEGYLATVTGGADKVTFSWCEFYYQPGQPRLRLGMLIGAPSGETKPLRVTLHHNWWSDLIGRRMPVTTYGHVHQYSNYFKPASSTPNVTGSEARASSQILSERNLYQGIASPLIKTNGGLIRVLNNTYTATTGTTADPGSDNVFVPSYSYVTLSNASLPSAIQTYSGNTSGASSPSLQPASMSINGPYGSIGVGTAITLNASITNITGATYQWRLNNTPIQGAITSSYTLVNAQTTHAGDYTATITLANGDTIVSSPFAVTVLAPYTPPETPANPASSSNSGGGGGSHSGWFLSALSLLIALRHRSRK